MKEQFLNLQGLTELVDYIKKNIADQQEVIPYASYTLFPTIGKQTQFMWTNHKCNL